ncbi:MAG TPA: helix-turn-helix domain-containing protein [Acidimicrobiales bacterium]|jgi:excisionase family DNA binding protein|nr:helix-turn-helix domain-containing protein [Acidimicrobiales bacterium]
MATSIPDPGQLATMGSVHPPDVPAPCLVETIDQRARRLGVSPVTIRRRIRSGQDPAFHVGGAWRLLPPGACSIAHLPKHCSVRQVANTLGVSELSVRRQIASGAMPAKKVGRAWLIPRRYLENLLRTAS